MSEWKEYKLGEVADVQTGPFGSQLHMDDYKEIGTPIITVEHLGDNRIIHNNLPLVGDEDKERLKKYTLCEGDIVFSRVGSVDRRAFVSSRENGWLFSGRCLRVRPLQSVNSQFLSYYFGLEGFKETIRRIAVGATMPSINTSILSNVTVYLPHLDEQQRIAGVLSSLDDKIDLLNRENATLEALVETLFRHYFIENPDPTWKEGKVSDVSFHCKDSINPQKHSDKTFLHYSIPAYDNGQSPTEEQGQNIQSNKYVVPQNCILFSKLNPHRDKRVWLMLDDVQPNTICSTEFQIVKPQDDKWLYFLYGWLTYKGNYDKIASGVSGTSGSHQRIDPKVIFDNECPIVDDRTLAQYNEQTKSLFKKIKTNQHQMKILAAHRNTLLPRLISGLVMVTGQ